MFSYCITPKLFQPSLRVFVSRARAPPCTRRCVDWSVIYPAHCGGENKEMQRPIDFADIGCGFGGLLVQLGEKFPDKISLGIEIREKVASYVDQRIRCVTLRAENLDKFFFL
jgi:tRNA G46 methylase TrmB